MIDQLNEQEPRIHIDYFCNDRIAGWLIENSSTLTSESLILISNKNPICALKINTDRVDVANAYAGARTRCGFDYFLIGDFFFRHKASMGLIINSSRYLDLNDIKNEFHNPSKYNKGELYRHNDEIEYRQRIPIDIFGNLIEIFIDGMFYGSIEPEIIGDLNTIRIPTKYLQKSSILAFIGNRFVEVIQTDIYNTLFSINNDVKLSIDLNMHGYIGGYFSRISENNMLDEYFILKGKTTGSIIKIKCNQNIAHLISPHDLPHHTKCGFLFSTNEILADVYSFYTKKNELISNYELTIKY